MNEEQELETEAARLLKELYKREQRRKRLHVRLLEWLQRCGKLKPSKNPDHTDTKKGGELLFTKSQVPRVVLLRTQGLGYLEVIETFKSKPAALRYVEHLPVPHTDLRLYEYQGRNLWLVHKVSALTLPYDHTMPLQLTLPL